MLIPPGLRDLLLSCAHEGVFRPVWQEEILAEVHRNSVRIGVAKHGLSEQQATAGVEHALSQMRRAFPEACAETTTWAPLMPHMTCDEKDRHVLAVAVGASATHLVTTNIRDFPVRSRPAGIAVVTADRFLRDQLRRDVARVVKALEAMSRRLKSPPQSPDEIAALLTSGRSAPQFGRELAEVLAARI